ncbi:glycosyl hydrolase family 92-domain-containing protein [Panaeolus papilionaceus]|nr:glycosyl hydrolase family 92-domain-containing protein [Panaeolus papilionaceus]
MYVTVAPERDWEVRYEDREENWTTKSERCLVRRRLRSYILARELNKYDGIMNLLLERALMSPHTLFNEETGFMEVWREDGSFVIIYDVGGSVASRGGRELSVRSLDKHFDGGYNDHTSEPSHHIPDLYAMVGAAWTTQESDRVIARSEYGDRLEGLSGMHIFPYCGQMSAWFMCTAVGFYPISPVSGEFVMTPFVKHQWIKDGREVVFEMIAKVKRWCDEGALRAFGGAEEEIKQVEWEDG